jgi:acetate---CoA ligase (ADP-forming)
LGKENPLWQIMHPRSIAWVGASNNPGKMGTIQLNNLLEGGFSGPVYPIHPTEKTVLGLQAYPNAAALPETPDLAFVVVPTRVAVEILEDLGKQGVERAVIVTGGFKEVDGEGRRREESLVSVAERYGMRFLGPNCIGVMHFRQTLNTTMFPMAAMPGPVGLVSQSGSYVTQVQLYLRRRGIRLSQAISVGNEASIDVVDCLDYFAAEEDTKAVILYLETLRRPRRFFEVAQELTRFKPVAVLYVGGTEAGGRAGMSHTGAMAGNDRLYDALFRQSGVLRVATLEDLYAGGVALACQPPLRGRRIGIVSHSGGPVTSMADACERYGLEVPVFSKSLQADLKPLLPATASAANPVDLTFGMGQVDMATTIPRRILESGEVDGLLIHGIMGSSYREAFFRHFEGMLGGISLKEIEMEQHRTTAELARMPGETGKPVICSSFMDRDQDDCTRVLQDNGIPVLNTPEQAVKVMGLLGRSYALRKAAP